MRQVVVVWLLTIVVASNAFTPCPLQSSFGSSSFTAYRDGSERSAKTWTSSSRLNMMFDQLAEAISSATKSLAPKKRMTENSIKPALRDVRRALLDADVNVNVADTLIEGVKKRSLGQEVLAGVTPEQQFVKAMYDELLDMMGGDSSIKSSTGTSAPAATLAVGSPDKPAVVLLAGLQGAGKTTAAGKLALYLKEREVDFDAMAEKGDEAKDMLSTQMPKRERKVLLVAADVYRPAAIKQLEILGERINVEVFSKGTDAKPVAIVDEAVQKAKEEGYDTVLVDTAGRQVIDADLMDELRAIQKKVTPDETLLVVDAMTGQEAASLTAAFDNAVGITGAVLTKMDGDSRGGAAVSVRGVSGKPIKFVGTGESTDDLEPFYPDRMASRILGMGDVISLVEKAAAQVSDAEALELQKKMLESKFDFDDFLKQAKVVSNMGNLAGVAKMMPGLSGQLNNSKMREAEARLKKSEAMICSMTKKERANPELLITDPTARSRLIRITKGSATKYDDGVNFMSEFQRMRTMMSRMQKQMGQGQMDPSAANNPTEDDVASLVGNRAMRRAAKKMKKRGRGGGGGFG